MADQGIVTRSRRRLSVESDAAPATPTKKDTLGQIAEEENPVTPLRKGRKSLMESKIINDETTDSPSRNLRSRRASTTSPEAIKAPARRSITKKLTDPPIEENNLASKPVNKNLTKTQLLTTVDSPKPRKNSKNVTETENLPVPARRRSRRLSGELNVVEEDPIEEEIQEVIKPIATTRRGKRLSVAPSQPCVPEENEDVELNEKIDVITEKLENITNESSTSMNEVDVPKNDSKLMEIATESSEELKSKRSLTPTSDKTTPKTPSPDKKSPSQGSPRELRSRKSFSESTSQNLGNKTLPCISSSESVEKRKRNKSLSAINDSPVTEKIIIEKIEISLKNDSPKKETSLGNDSPKQVTPVKRSPRLSNKNQSNIELTTSPSVAMMENLNKFSECYVALRENDMQCLTSTPKPPTPSKRTSDHVKPENKNDTINDSIHETNISTKSKDSPMNTSRKTRSMSKSSNNSISEDVPMSDQSKDTQDDYKIENESKPLDDVQQDQNKSINKEQTLVPTDSKVTEEVSRNQSSTSDCIDKKEENQTDDSKNLNSTFDKEITKSDKNESKNLSIKDESLKENSLSDASDHKDVKFTINDDSDSGSESTLNRDGLESGSDSDDIKMVLDSASDAGMDYESGDSKGETDDENMKYEIEDKGISLQSEDSNLDLGDDSYEKDSFVCSSNEEDEELLSGTGDDLGSDDNELTQSKKSKEKYDKRELKKRKEASREMYKARHSESPNKSGKKRNRIISCDSDTSENETEEAYQRELSRLNNISVNITTSDSSEDGKQSTPIKSTDLDTSAKSDQKVKNDASTDVVENLNKSHNGDLSMNGSKSDATSDAAGDDENLQKSITMNGVEKSQKRKSSSLNNSKSMSEVDDVEITQKRKSSSLNSSKSADTMDDEEIIHKRASLTPNKCKPETDASTNAVNHESELASPLRKEKSSLSNGVEFPMNRSVNLDKSLKRKSASSSADESKINISATNGDLDKSQKRKSSQSNDSIVASADLEKSQKRKSFTPNGSGSETTLTANLSNDPFAEENILASERTEKCNGENDTEIQSKKNKYKKMKSSKMAEAPESSKSVETEEPQTNGKVSNKRSRREIDDRPDASNGGFEVVDSPGIFKKRRTSESSESTWSSTAGEFKVEKRSKENPSRPITASDSGCTARFSVRAHIDHPKRALMAFNGQRHNFKEAALSKSGKRSEASALIEARKKLEALKRRNVVR